MSNNDNFEEVKMNPMNGGGVREVEILNKLNYFLEKYESLFKAKYGSKPIRVKDDEEVARWAAIKLGDQSSELLAQYFLSDGDDNWFSKQAHSLYCFKQNINRVVSGIKYGRNKPEFVVTLSADNGYPVLSRNPAELKNDLRFLFEPILFTEWLKLNFLDKIQSPKLKWYKPEAIPCDLSLWERNYKEWWNGPKEISSTY